MQNNEPISENPCPSVANKERNPNWGGARPGAGAPKGNLNAFKHGRTSRRQAQLLEAAIQIPQVRQALIDLANRERRRRKQAEEGYGVLMTHLLEKRRRHRPPKRSRPKQPRIPRLPQHHNRRNAKTSRKTIKTPPHHNQPAPTQRKPPRRTAGRSEANS